MANVAEIEGGPSSMLTKGGLEEQIQGLLGSNVNRNDREVMRWSCSVESGV